MHMSKQINLKIKSEQIAESWWTVIMQQKL